LEIKEFKAQYQRQLDEIKAIAVKIQASWEKMNSNCSSWHDRQKCTRLSAEFHIMMSIVVSGYLTLCSGKFIMKISVSKLILRNL
jgi:hypothetical protein